MKSPRLMVLGVVGGVYFEDAFLRRYVDPEHRALGMALFGLGYPRLRVVFFPGPAKLRTRGPERTAREPGDELQSKCHESIPDHL